MYKNRLTFKKLAGYFFQGLLFVAPITITLFVIFSLITWIDEAVYAIIPIDIPGLGFLLIIAFVTFIGFLSSSLLFQGFFGAFERFMGKTPLVKIIYSAIRDLFSAFVSDQKRFSKPVLVTLNHNPLVQRLGFITQENLANWNIINKIAVYVPHSYNISGNLLVVEKENVTVIEGVSATDAMKFMVSGGISDTGKKEENL